MPKRGFWGAFAVYQYEINAPGGSILNRYVVDEINYFEITTYLERHIE